MTELEGFYYCCERKSIILEDLKLLVIGDLHDGVIWLQLP